LTALGRVVHIGPEAGDAFRIGPDRFRTLGGPSQRAEEYAAIVYEAAAGVPGPPLHRHTKFEEAWFILDGKVEFLTARRPLVAAAGSYLRIPRGVPHTFRVVGGRPARWLGIISPGSYVKLLQELGRLVPPTGPPDAAKVARLFARYDTELV